MFTKSLSKSQNFFLKNTAIFCENSKNLQKLNSIIFSWTQQSFGKHDNFLAYSYQKILQKQNCLILIFTQISWTFLIIFLSNSTVSVIIFEGSFWSGAMLLLRRHYFVASKLPAKNRIFTSANFFFILFSHSSACRTLDWRNSLFVIV